MKPRAGRRGTLFELVRFWRELCFSSTRPILRWSGSVGLVAFLVSMLTARPVAAQLAPTGGHYAARTTDTGFMGTINASGGYSTSVRLELPPARGSAQPPVGLVYTERGFGAAGLGWDIPSSYIRFDQTIDRRKPRSNALVGRDDLVVVIAGERIRVVATSGQWMGQDNPQIEVRAQGSGWVLYDGDGRTFVFEVVTGGLSGVNLWHLTEIRGSDGSRVVLTYDARSAPRLASGSVIGLPGDALVVELREITYNPHPSIANCFKNRITFSPGSDASEPLAVTLVGGAVLARTHVLASITTWGRETCSVGWAQLRRHDLNYTSDPDTGQLQLVSATVAGRPGTAEASQKLPLGSFGYGTASVSNGNGGRKFSFVAATPIAMPAGAESQPLGKSFPLGGAFWETPISLIDLTGDGRADYFYRFADGSGRMITGHNVAGQGGSIFSSVSLFSPTATPFACNTSTGPGCSDGHTRGIIDVRNLEGRALLKNRYDWTGLNSEVLWRQLIDFNGDGRLDIVDAREVPGRWVVYLNTPASRYSAEIAWQRITLDITSLKTELAALHHNYIGDYLPLSVRTTGKAERTGVCWFQSRPTQVIAMEQCVTVAPFDQVLLSRFVPEMTWTEWELRDLNGDGYPDLVFNKGPVQFQSSMTEYPNTWLGEYGFGSTGTAVGPTDATVLAKFNRSGVWLHEGGPLLLTDTVQIRSETKVDLTTFDQTLYRDNHTVILHGRRAVPCGVGLWVDLPPDPGATGPDGKDLQYQACGFLDMNGDGLADRVEGAFGYSERSTAYLWNQTTAYLWNGGSAGYGNVTTSLPAPLAVHSNNRALSCADKKTTTYTVQQVAAYRDVNGDGIADYVYQGHDYEGPRVCLGTGLSIRSCAALDMGTIEVPLSQGAEDCSTPATFSTTTSGWYDIDGDGKVDALIRTGANINVYRLSGSRAPGAPEAGRLNQIDNGYGAVTQIRYGSAKDDPTGAVHSVPMPENVVLSVSTTDRQGVALIAPTSYAYLQPEMVFDAVADQWRFSGYRRTVALTSASAQDGTAIVTSTHGLSDPIVTDPMTYDAFNKAFLRNAVVGRPYSVITLRGNIGDDPWALLYATAADPRVIAGTSYRYGGRLLQQVEASGCWDMTYPYDWDKAVGYTKAPGSGQLYDPCRSRGFVFASSTESWRGTAAPSNANVTTSTTIGWMDDYGRPTQVLATGDVARTDDDLCIMTTYATPTGSGERVLSAVSSERTYAFDGSYSCVGGTVPSTTPLAERYFEYDCTTPGSCPKVDRTHPTGTVSRGFLTGSTIANRRTDDGGLIADLRVFDITNDSFGNPLTITTQRTSPPATRATTISYDPFGMTRQRVEVTATSSNASLPTLTTMIDLDPLTLEVRGETDPVGTTTGAIYDGFGRITATTLTPSGGTTGYLSATAYTGFDTGGPRTVASKTFPDPVSSPSTAGRSSTAFLDVLGRATRSEVALGSDYASAPTLVVGERSYDAFGRVVFEADPHSAADGPNFAYGTSYFFNTDGTPSCTVRGPGRQFTIPQSSNEAQEMFVSCTAHQFSNHSEIFVERGADSLLGGAPQSGMEQVTWLDATSRVLQRFSQRDGMIYESALHGYDRLGNLTSMARWSSEAADATTTSWRYDALGHIVELDEPGTLPQYRHYDSWGQLTQMAWTETTAGAEGDRAVWFLYDALGRLVRSYAGALDRGAVHPDYDTLSQYWYDDPVVISSPGQVTPTNTRGRLTAATTIRSQMTLSYDALGRVNARTYSDDETGPYIEKRAYHADGTLDTLNFLLPDNQYKDEQVAYKYDSAGRAQKVTFSDGPASRDLFVASVTDPLGRVRQSSYGALSYAARYTDGGRRMLDRLTFSSPLAKAAGGGRREIQFTPVAGAPAFDPLGRERGRVEISDGESSSIRSSYDPLGRLAAVQGPQPVNYGYDALGNLLFQRYDRANAASTAVIDYDTPAQHQADGLSADRDRMCHVQRGDQCETPAVACARVHVACGYVVNNCQEAVLCPNTCADGMACGVGGPNTCGAADPSFNQWANASGANAITGDFNGDGRSDIALVGGLGWWTIPVAFSHGDGTFSVINEPQGVWAFAAWATAPGAQIVAGDVNGDGRTDLFITGGAGWWTIPVAFSNGDGSFHVTNLASSDIPGLTALAGAKVAAGDVNGDGRADLIYTGVAAWTGLGVALSNGDGTFTVSASARDQRLGPFTLWSARSGVRVVAGDFNGDRRADLALMANPGSNWSALPVALAKPDGTFSVAEVATDLARSLTDGSPPLAGDIDGDGRTDLASQSTRGAMKDVLFGRFNPAAPAAVVGGPISNGGGLCLDVPGGSSANGIEVQMWECNNWGSAQQWMFGGDDTIRALGKCLDGGGPITVNGRRARLWDCNGTAAQRWTWWGGWLMNQATSDLLKSVGDFQAGNTNGAPVVLGSTNGDWLSPRLNWTAYPNLALPSLALSSWGVSAPAGQAQALVAGDFNGDGRSDWAEIGGGTSNIRKVTVWFSGPQGRIGSAISSGLPNPSSAGPNAFTGGRPATGDLGPCNVKYDGLGSVVQMPTASGTRNITYQYDGRVRTIEQAGASAHVYYDALGAVQQLSVTGASIDARDDHHFGPSLLLHDENGTAVLTRTVGLPGGGTAVRHGPSGTWVFQLGEPRGRRYAADQDGVFVQETRYSPYGDATSTGPAAQPGSELYASAQWNGGDLLAAFGLTRLGARLYDPAVGRFLSRDPLLAVRTGATTNPYAFAFNDPINGSDPTGFDCVRRYGGEAIPCPDFGTHIGTRQIARESRAVGIQWAKSGIPLEDLERSLGSTDPGELIDIGLVRTSYRAYTSLYGQYESDVANATDAGRLEWQFQSFDNWVATRYYEEHRLELLARLITIFAQPARWGGGSRLSSLEGAVVEAEEAESALAGLARGLEEACGQGSCFVAGTLVATSSGARPIEQVQLGDRVEAGDPECAGQHLSADARAIELELLSDDGTPGQGRLTVARPAAWLDEMKLGVGTGVLITPELGARRVRVVRVGPRPQEAAGDGCLVRMTSAHIADEIVAVRLDSGTAIEVTPEHPLLAEGDGWIAAGSLQPGMLLRTDHGTARVTSLASAPGGRMVYNLDEVDLAHAYRVSADQVWSHNACCIRPEAKFLRGAKHGLKWQEGPARAKKEMKPQGQWGSVTELDYASEKAATLAPNQWGEFDLPPGSRSTVWMPDGTAVQANRFKLRNNGTGTWHGYPTYEPPGAPSAPNGPMLPELTPIDKL